MSGQGLRRWLGARVGRGVVAGLAALSLVPPAIAAKPRNVAPEAAPKAWLAFAETTSARIAEWLRAPDEPAVRLRAHVDALRPAPDQSSPPIALRVWVDATGAIERVDFAPFADETVNADLRSLLVGRAIGARPPRRMLQPLALGVRLDPAR